MNAWESLVERVGLEEAKKIMSQRRSMVKNLGNGGFKASPELAKRASKLGVQAREAKRKERQSAQEDS